MNVCLYIHVKSPKKINDHSADKFWSTANLLFCLCVHRKFEVKITGVLPLNLFKLVDLLQGIIKH